MGVGGGGGGDVCFPWDLILQLASLSSGCGVLRIVSAIVCLEGAACCLPGLLVKHFVSKRLALDHPEEV